WPFGHSYELSIVGYKNLESGQAGTPASVGGGHLYHSLSVQNSSVADPTDQQRAPTTSSHLVVPSTLVTRGQCSNEAFQKPIERNPPCGVKELLHWDLGVKRQSRAVVEQADRKSVV